MRIEAVLLTGGASSRMGIDKADLLVDGVPLGRKIALALSSAGYPVKVLGRQPLAGFPFQKDIEEFGGPLIPLSEYRPTRESVFVCACDLPQFDERIVSLLSVKIGRSDVAAPEVNGRLQPLCGLYRSAAFDVARSLASEGRRSMMAWLERLAVVRVNETDFQSAGLDPEIALGVNTRAELDEALHRRKG